MTNRTAIIIGAGPAGLTAAFELLSRTDIQPVVLEMSEYMGGISRTVNYKGNRIDIGGHRFFSKSDRVMQWWLDFLPLEEPADAGAEIAYHGQRRTVAAAPVEPGPRRGDTVMLVRTRLSRIYFMRRFFSYPISLSVETIRNLGIPRTIGIGFSYLRSVLFPIRPEKNLEDFFINRFGRRLYLTFFKSYTEKVWGVPCDQISAGMGRAAHQGPLDLQDAAPSGPQAGAFPRRGDLPEGHRDLAHREIHVSQVRPRPDVGGGGPARHRRRAARFSPAGAWNAWSTATIAASKPSGPSTAKPASAAASPAISSSPPCRSKSWSARSIRPLPPVSGKSPTGSMYRDFLTVGLLCKRLRIRDRNDGGNVKDNWIYIQEPDVQVGRLQIFNNWSPFMVADPDTVWIGLEYFCNESDDLWNMPDADLIELAKAELVKIGLSSERGCARRHCDPHAQDLPGLLRHATTASRKSSPTPMAWRTSSWWAATACTATTTRTTRC